MLARLPSEIESPITRQYDSRRSGLEKCERWPMQAAVGVQMSFPRVAVIVINFRTPQLTMECLESLERQIGPGSKVFLLDSASADGSVEILREKIKEKNWGEWVRLVSLPENRGFSAGNNSGIGDAARNGAFDAYLLLNSDTVLRAGALDCLREALRREPSVGLAGPRLEWPTGQVQASCFHNLSPVSELVAAAKTGPVSRIFRRGEVVIENPSENGRIDWISFACVLIRREVVESIGGLDDGFFMYFEDVDYCRRARAAGWKIAYVPQARVVHLRGGQTPETFALKERERRPDYFYHSRARYMAKYYGPIGPILANACWLAGRSVSLVRELLGDKTPHAAACEASDIWKGSLCGILRSRSKCDPGER